MSLLITLDTYMCDVFPTFNASSNEYRWTHERFCNLMAGLSPTVMLNSTQIEPHRTTNVTLVYTHMGIYRFVSSEWCPEIM